MPFFRRDRRLRGVWVIANLPANAKAGSAIEARRSDGSRTLVLLERVAIGDSGERVGIVRENPPILSLISAAKKMGL